MSLQPNWEYKTIHLDEDDLDILEQKLNTLGLEAWELVSWDSEVGIFKRKQLCLVEPYTGSGTHKHNRFQNQQPKIN